MNTLNIVDIIRRAVLKDAALEAVVVNGESLEVKDSDDDSFTVTITPKKNQEKKPQEFPIVKQPWHGLKGLSTETMDAIVLHASTTFSTGSYCKDWTEEDSWLAKLQGWDIFTSDYDTGELEEIQRDDEAAIFPSDLEAWKHVWAGAKDKTNVTAMRAIDYLKVVSPKHYAYLQLNCD